MNNFARSFWLSFTSENTHNIIINRIGVKTSYSVIGECISQRMRWIASWKVVIPGPLEIHFRLLVNVIAGKKILYSVMSELCYAKTFKNFRVTCRAARIRLISEPVFPDRLYYLLWDSSVNPHKRNLSLKQPDTSRSFLLTSNDQSFWRKMTSTQPPWTTGVLSATAYLKNNLFLLFLN